MRGQQYRAIQRNGADQSGEVSQGKCFVRLSATSETFAVVYIQMAILTPVPARETLSAQPWLALAMA